MRNYKLIRSFTIYSMITFLVTALLLTYFIRNHIKQDSISDSVEMTTINLDTLVKPKLDSSSLDGAVSVELKKYLDDNFAYLVKRNELVYSNILDNTGATLYSSRNPQSGKYLERGNAFASALNGDSSYQIGTLDSDNNESIEIYVPIKSGNKVIGVYEEVKSYDKIIMHLNAVTTIILITVFTGLILLYFLLLRIVYSSSKTLVVQNEALIQSRNELELSYDKLNSAYKETVIALSNAVDARDTYTAGHSTRVTEISLEIGAIMGLTQKSLDTLEVAAQFHDIGKIGIPDAVLNKPGKLTDEEFAIIKQHPQIGVSILNNINFVEAALPIILHHHERYSGGGYPKGIHGQSIPIEARIISVADTYDAMTSDRPYRKGLTPQVAIDELKAHAGEQFDASVVAAFLKTETANIK